MATDDPQKLKRFQYLEIDGVPRRPRPPKRVQEPAPPAPVRRAGTASARPAAPAPAEPRRYAPAARPAPAPPAPRRSADPPRPTPIGGGATTSVREREFVLDLMQQVPVERTPWDTPGVYVEEVDLSERFGRSQPRSYARPAPPARAEPAPIELTEMAARQIRLLAYQHGVSGAGLRILTSVGGECDFAFEMSSEPDDVVFLSQGIRVVIDEGSLRGLRGRRITYQDVPGAEGFRIT